MRSPALDYAMNRYYGNTTGRFNSPDKAQPILYDPGTLNRYTYVSNDPVNLLDDSRKYTGLSAG